MKLLLHYLKFDRLALSPLPGMLWSLVPVWIGLMAIVGSWRMVEDQVWIVSTLSNCVFGGGVILFAIICLRAGGMDSTARAETWLMTRPRHGRARAGSRALHIFGGAVLPAMVAWWGTLLVMGFNAASIWAEFPVMLGTVLAVAAALALAALVPLCLPGVIIGGLLACLSLILLAIPAAKPVRAYYGGSATMLTTAAACLVGLLPALESVRRRLTRREWAIQGFLCGLTGVFALLIFIPVQNWIAFRHPFTELLALRGLEEWQVTLSKEKKVTAIPDHYRGVTIQLPLAPDERFSGRVDRAWNVHGFSWRANRQSGWSPWIGMERPFRPAAETIVDLECEPHRIGDMDDGELRLLVQLPPEMRLQPLPVDEVQELSGQGWCLEIPPPHFKDARMILNYVSRRLPGSAHLPAVEFNWPELPAEMNGSNTFSSGHSTSRGFPWVTVGFWKEFARPIPLNRITNSRALAVEWQDHPPKQMRLFRISGITLRPPRPLPQEEPAPNAPARKSIWPQITSKSAPYTRGEAVISPFPLADALIPPLPPQDATDAEVATYLHHLVAVRGMGVVLREQQFAPLVPRWLPLFLRLVEQKQFSTPDAVTAALAQTTPEEQRSVLISRLPFAPELMKVIVRRGWLAEARPFVIETLLRDERIPDDGNWHEAILLYRDPALAPLLRRLWTPVMANVKLWEALPELASELPAKLEQMREYVRGIGSQPGPKDDSVIEALLYAGDPVGLEALLRFVRTGNRFGRFDTIAHQFLRPSDGKQLSWDPAARLSFIGDSTAADYRFNRDKRLWIRLPPQP